MTPHDDDDAVLKAGYQPQLRRSLGAFSSFAISFSLMSITTGIFANYGFVLQKAGPFGFWTWPLVAGGQILVALVFAELAGRIPLTGAAYSWNRELSSPAIGWLTGWMALFVYTIAVAAVSSTIVPVLAAMIGHEIDTFTATLVPVILVVGQALINSAGIHLMSRSNVLAVAAEIVGMGVLGCSVLFTILIRGQPNLSLLTTIPTQPQPYWHGFLIAALLGSWTLVGFETAADMSEETLRARLVTPHSIISSILASAGVGFIFIVIMTLAIPDVESVSSAPYPLAEITDHYFGHTITNIFLAFVVVAMYSCSLVCMTSASRLLFAMARDNQFIASTLFRRISRQSVPLYSVWLVTFVACVLVFMADSVTSLIGADSILAALVYLLTVISFAWGLKGLPPSDTFTLGKWRWLVIITALAWLAIEIGILTVPQEFHSAAVAAAGVLALGVVLYSAATIFKPGSIRH